MNERRELHFNAFYAGTPSQSWSGLWTHPRSTGLDYNRIDFWIDLAKQAEKGLLDGIFLADTLAVSDVYGGSPEALIRAGTFFPVNDPMLLIPAMAAVTKYLCFGVTGNTTYEPPYLLARRFSTLDHLTDGRIAWNIVTGVVDAAARAMGVQPVPHDQRYDLADEYMALVYKLWECSWLDGAVVRDKARRMFADPSKVRPIQHRSAHFACEGVHMCEPSPQRTPLLFSAGASASGLRFAGAHAECTFMSTNNLAFARKTANAFREAAVMAGRTRESVKVFNAATVIVAPTEAQARDLVREYQGYVSEAGNLAAFSSWLGVDLARYAPEDPIEVVDSNAIQSIANSMRASRADGKVTIADLAKFADVSGREAFIVGSAEQVCNEIIRWRDEGDLDGFNLVRTVEPDGLQAFIDLVVPRLQERGAYKSAYAPGSMREQLFTTGSAKLPDDHPGAVVRRAAKVAEGALQNR